MIWRAMNPQVKEKFLAALRSDQYSWTKGVLRSFYGDYCAAGVLCDLHAKETGGKWVGTSYLNYTDRMPPLVRQWAGLDKESKLAYDPSQPHLRATMEYLNDNYWRFAKLASLIEAQW